MTFSRCGSYHKDTCYNDRYLSIQHVLKKIERMTAFEN